MLIQTSVERIFYQISNIRIFSQQFFNFLHLYKFKMVVPKVRKSQKISQKKICLPFVLWTRTGKGESAVELLQRHHARINEIGGKIQMVFLFHIFISSIMYHTATIMSNVYSQIDQHISTINVTTKTVTLVLTLEIRLKHF